MIKKDELIRVQKIKCYPHLVGNGNLVSVCIVTFNHENYIKQCLDGILKQECDFKFEILIGEDDSSDNTRKICVDYAEKFPDKIRLFLHHRDNVIYIGGKATGRFNYLYNFSQSNGKYIALCEGDDYWTDPLKLQKQVDFLEKNNDFVLCGTDSERYNEHSKEELKSSILNNVYNIEYRFDDLLEKNRFITNTVVFRNLPIVKDLPNWFMKVPFGDWPLYALLTQYGKGINLDFTSGVYREHGSGIYSSSGNFNRNFNHSLVYKTFWDNFQHNRLLKGKLRNWLLWSMYTSSNRKQEIAVLKVYVDAFKFQGFFKKAFYKMLLKIVKPNK